MSTSAEAVAAAAASCPGVARLSRGMGTEVATYLPDRRVHGVRMRDEAVDVHVVAEVGVVLPELASRIRSAVAPLVEGRPVDVHVDDLDVDPPAADDGPGAPVGGPLPSQPT